MGQINSTSITPGTIVNSDIATGAGIETSKMVHQHVFSIDFNLDDADTPVTTEMTFYLPSVASTIKEVKAWLVDTGSSTNIDFDVEINGTSALTGVVNFTNADTNQSAKSGTIATSSVTASQYLTAVMTVTSATGALGGKMQVIVDSAVV